MPSVEQTPQPTQEVDNDRLKLCVRWIQNFPPSISPRVEENEDVSWNDQGRQPTRPRLPLLRNIHFPCITVCIEAFGDHSFKNETNCMPMYEHPYNKLHNFIPIFNRLSQLFPIQNCTVWNEMTFSTIRKVSQLFPHFLTCQCEPCLRISLATCRISGWCGRGLSRFH
jgi:hypothetical protein